VDDVAAQAHPGRAQRLDPGGEVVDLELDAVPPAGLRAGAVGGGLGGPAGAARLGQQQPQRPAGEDREAGAGASVDGEASRSR